MFTLPIAFPITLPGIGKIEGLTGVDVALDHANLAAEGFVVAELFLDIFAGVQQG